MFTFSNSNGESLLSSKLQFDITANNLKRLSTIELLRLRGKSMDSQFKLNTIQTELNRRHRRENLVYAALIAGAVILISVLI